MTPKANLMRICICQFLFLVALTFSFLFVSTSFTMAGTFRSVTTGNWNSPSTWILVSGSDADGIPDGDDVVNVVGAFGIIVNVPSACSSLTFLSDPSASLITISGANKLTVTGDLIMNEPTLGSRVNMIDVGAGRLTVGGDLVLDGDDNAGIANDRTTQVRISTGILTVTGNITEQGDDGFSSIFCTNTATVNIGGAGTTTGNGTPAFATGITFEPASSTVNYNRSGDQNIRATTYFNLTTSGSGSKKLDFDWGGDVTHLRGSLSIGVGTTMYLLDNTDLHVDKRTLISGALRFYDVDSTQVFLGPVTNNGFWDNRSANATITMADSLVSTGTFVSGTGAYQFHSTVGGPPFVAISGTPLTIRGLLSIRGMLLYNASNLTVLGNVQLVSGATSELLNQGILNVAGQILDGSSINKLYTSSLNNTVEYIGNGAQNIVTPGGDNYQNLILAGSGVKSSNFYFAINDTLSLQGTATADFDTVHYYPGSVLEYKGDAARTTGSEFQTSMNVPVIVNNVGTVQLNASKTIDSLLAFFKGTLATGAFTVTLGPIGFISGEAPGQYLVGTLNVSRTVGTGGNLFGGMGVSINAGIDNLGTVSINRISGSAGIVTSNGHQSIARKWIMASTSQPTNGRTLTLTWPASDDNGVNATSVIVYRSASGNPPWVAVAGPLNADHFESRVATIPNVTTLSGVWTVASASAPLKVSASQTESDLPTEFGLGQNYPNPFNPSTTISYSLPKDSRVRLKVFDLLGREVATLVDDFVEAGNHAVVFDASPLASGMYIYRIAAGGFTGTRKLLLMK